MYIPLLCIARNTANRSPLERKPANQIIHNNQQNIHTRQQTISSMGAQKARMKKEHRRKCKEMGEHKPQNINGMFGTFGGIRIIWLITDIQVFSMVSIF